MTLIFYLFYSFTLNKPSLSLPTGKLTRDFKVKEFLGETLGLRFEYDKYEKGKKNKLRTNFSQLYHIRSKEPCSTEECYVY